MLKYINLSEDLKSAYLESLAPYLNEIRNCVLPKLNASTISNSPAFYGVSYKKQVEMALSGDIDALRHIAVLLYDGIHLPHNKDLALNILKSMAFGTNTTPEGFHPPAAYSFAKLMIREGNTGEAIDILQRLIDAKFWPAYALKGNMHQYGSGVEPNFNLAEMYYKKAQSNDHIYAVVLRAKMHFQHGNPIKKTKGFFLYIIFIFKTFQNEFTAEDKKKRWASFY